MQSTPLVGIEAGTLLVGSSFDDAAAHTDEFPIREVTISNAIGVGLWPVTRKEFEVYATETGFAPDGGCRTLTADGWAVDPEASWIDPGFNQTPSDPVVCVSREDAMGYVDWLSGRTGQHYRLPSEAEWAHMAGPVEFWSAPEDVCEFGNINDLSAKNKVAKVAEPCVDGFLYTSPVVSFLPNTKGIYDVIGNVWEWTADCHNGGYEFLPTDGAPQQANDCEAYALRGHSWTDPPGPVRLGTRYALPSDARQSIVGFRIVQDISDE